MIGSLDHLGFTRDSLAPWRDDAACKGLTELFYPPPFGSPEPPEERDVRIEQCRQICILCPVIDPCRQWALGSVNEGIDMVLAGMTYEERWRAIRGRRRR